MERAKTTKIVLVHGVGHKQGPSNVRPIWLPVVDRVGQGLCPTCWKIDLTSKNSFQEGLPKSWWYLLLTTYSQNCLPYLWVGTV